MSCNAFSIEVSDFVEFLLLHIYRIKSKLLGLDQSAVLLEGSDRILKHAGHCAFLGPNRTNIVLIVICITSSKGHNQHFEAD